MALPPAQLYRSVPLEIPASNHHKSDAGAKIDSTVATVELTARQNRPTRLQQRTKQPGLGAASYPTWLNSSISPTSRFPDK